MKSFCFTLILFIANITGAQNLQLAINTGNHDNIISSYYDRENNQLIALDKLGFVVCWDVANFSIINKFQLPPENPFVTTRKQMLGRYEVKAFDSTITITYPTNAYQYNVGERVVDVYNRRTGTFISQTPYGKISSIAFTKDGSVYTTTSGTTKSGYVEVFNEGTLTKTHHRSKAVTISLDEVATCIQTDENKKRLAIGYRNGKVEIRDLQSLQLIQTFTDLNKEKEAQINQLVFIPASNKIAFVVERSGKIIIRDIESGSLAGSMELEDNDYRLAVSPSGKYLSVLDDEFYDLYWYDLQNKKTEKKKILDNSQSLGMFLSEVFFLNDNLLLGTGRNSTKARSIKINGMGNVGAWLGLIDAKTNMASANLNITTASSWMSGYGTQMLKHSALQTIIHGFSDEFAYTDPSTFTVQSGKLTDKKDEFNKYLKDHNYPLTYASILSRVGSNSAPDLSNADIAATIYNVKHGWAATSQTDTFMLAYYNIPADSFFKATKLIIPLKEAPYYHLMGVLSKTGLSFFEHTYSSANRRKTELVICNADGKKVLTDSLVNSYSDRTISISPDQNYIAYQPKPGELIVRSLKDLSVVHTIKTGFSKYQNEVTGFAYPWFSVSKSSVLLHETFQVVNNSRWFCLLATNIHTNKTDTLISIALRPITYQVDSTEKQVTMLYNYDFTDSAFNNNEVVTKAAAHGFKSLYQPSVLQYDVRTNEFTRSVHTGSAGIFAASQNGKWLTVLQNDGQLVYFNSENKNARIAHVIDEQSQALVADSFYYANQGLVPLIRLENSNRLVGASQADIYLNRPHDILSQFVPGNNELLRPYKMAWNKRIEQQHVDHTNVQAVLKEDRGGKMMGITQPFVYTKQRQVDLDFKLSSNNIDITRIQLLLNGQPIFGKKGVNTKKALADKKITIQLSRGDNYITITGETASGKQLDPVKYYYYFDPEVFQPSKLYFFSAGVSDYKDSTYNLRYAAKDAEDIFQAFKYKVADTVISNVLLNKQVTRQNINAWAKQIEQAGVDDVVILYFAGHGLLDAQNNFYYAAHDMDFNQPEKYGMSYEAILDLLDKSPSRKKILLLDACHSGSFDRSLAKPSVKTLVPDQPNIISNEKRRSTVKGTKPLYTERQAFILMNQMFVDFSNDIGIDVVAASLGNSFALEKESLQNGLFTYAMIRAVALGMASGRTDETETVSMEQVKKYIEKEVKILSNGEQVPSIRSSNVQSGMIEFIYSWNKIKEESYAAFLEKYK